METDKLQAIFWKGDIDNYWLGHQFAEIFKERIYAPYLEDKKDATIIDIGGNIGLFSLYASKYAKQIYTLEPSLEHFDSINRMLVFNGITNVKPINKALYIENKPLPFYHNKNRTMYSLHMAVEDKTQPVETVEAITLEQLFKDEKINRVDLLKIDCEGSEYEILAHPSFQSVADKIDVVIGESHSWAGRHLNQLRESLKECGFIVEGIPNDAEIFVGRKPKTTGTKF